MHQKTLNAIQKRKGPLITAINRFNGYCRKLRSLKHPSWNVLIPTELPTNLRQLREDSDLMEDVWINPNGDYQKPLPAYLVNLNVRKGIQALVKLERCQEESDRLLIECRNLSQWFFDEMCALELAAILSKGE